MLFEICKKPSIQTILYKRENDDLVVMSTVDDDLIKGIVSNEIKKIKQDELSVLVNSQNCDQVVNDISKSIIPIVNNYSKNVSNDNHIMYKTITSILHHLLTICIIPSQRKITYKEEEIDIVIPNLKALIKEPSKTLMIIIIENAEDDVNAIKSKIQRLLRIIPSKDKKKNLWLISRQEMDVIELMKDSSSEKENDIYHADIKIFVVGKTFATIITEIKRFLNKNKVSSSTLGILKIK